MKIVIPDPIDLSSVSRQKIRGLGAAIYNDLPEDTSTLVARIKDAEIITANYIDVTPEVVDGAPNLKYIVVPAVGYEWIDVAYASSKGIKVLNCPTFNSQAVAEHALALLFAINRQVCLAVTSLKNGDWEHDPFVGMELHGKRVGLIGYGNIGKRIEKLLSGFDVELIIVNSKSTQDEVDNLMRQADVICICAPLNDSTKHMIDARRLSLCKPAALLVNVGRGAVIDQVALLHALETGKLKGAGMDVFEGEPLTGKPSDQIIKLANMPNVIATPHIAYNTTETAEKLGQEVLDDIQSCLDGRPIHLVS